MIVLITALCYHFIVGAEVAFLDKSYLQPLKAFKNVLAWNPSSFCSSFLNEGFHWKFGEIPVSIFWVTEAIKLDIFHLHVISGTIWSMFLVKVIGKKLCVSIVPKVKLFLFGIIYVKCSVGILILLLKPKTIKNSNINFYLLLNDSIYICSF